MPLPTFDWIASRHDADRKKAEATVARVVTNPWLNIPADSEVLIRAMCVELKALRAEVYALRDELSHVRTTVYSYDELGR